MSKLEDALCQASLIMPSVLNQKIISVVNVFCYLVFYKTLWKRNPIHPKMHAFCDVWLKFDHWFLRILFLKIFKIFSLFGYGQLDEQTDRRRKTGKQNSLVSFRSGELKLWPRTPHKIIFLNIRCKKMNCQKWQFFYAK